MRNLAWSVIVLGMTSTAAMAQEPAPKAGLASATVSPAALPALAASVVLGADQAAAQAASPGRSTGATAQARDADDGHRFPDRVHVPGDLPGG